MFGRWKTSLRSKLTLVFLPAIFVPTCLLSTFTYFHVKESLEHATVLQLESVIALKAKAIENWLKEEKRVIRVLAQAPIVQELASDVLMSTENDPKHFSAKRQLTDYLTAIAEKMDDVERISILNNTGGREILSTSEKYIGRYHLADSFFTLGREQTYVQKILRDTKNNETKMIVATPIRNTTDELVGVLYTVLEPDTLNDVMLERTGLGESGETYLVDSRNAALTPLRKGDSRYLSNLDTAGAQNAKDHHDRHPPYVNYAGERVIGLYYWLDEPKITIVAEISEQDAFAALDHFSVVLFLTSLLLISLAYAITAAIAKRISIPILAVSETASSVAAGNLDQQVPVLTEDEIGALSKAFNTMTKSLRDSVNEKDRAFQQLQETNERLRAATQSKNLFLANMSHELRTPLNAIIGYSEILLENAVEDRLHDYIPDLRKINSSGEHLLALISDILDIARIEEGKIVLHYEELSILDLVNSIASTVQPLIERNHNKLIVSCPSDIGVMTTDVTRVKQALFNLLSNAAKFTDNGSIWIDVRKTSENGRKWVLFSVGDTGIGIPQDKIDHIFEQFAQADVSSTKKYGGAGLGLAITKWFCELMSGTISVTSNVGEGSEFTIKLPEEGAARPTRRKMPETTNSQDMAVT